MAKFSSSRRFAVICIFWNGLSGSEINSLFGPVCHWDREATDHPEMCGAWIAFAAILKGWQHGFIAKWPLAPQAVCVKGAYASLSTLKLTKFGFVIYLYNNCKLWLWAAKCVASINAQAMKPWVSQLTSVFCVCVYDSHGSRGPISEPLLPACHVGQNKPCGYTL